jgi:hypothetical protein
VSRCLRGGFFYLNFSVVSANTSDAIQKKLKKVFSVSPCLRGGFFYLNFSVVSANSANTSDAIQKRTITFDSDQPNSSK